MKELDFSKEIRAQLREIEGTEEEITQEAWAAEEKKGKKLNKPFRTPGGPKKFSVYVKNEKGNVVKVNFGDPNMEIKRDDPARRKSFRARHNCDSPGPKTKAKYWSCKMWSKKSVTKVTKGNSPELLEAAEEELAAELDESIAKRPGPKSGAQTPAKPSEKKKGSSKNKPGSAGEKGSKITFSEKVINALKQKVSDHNKKHPGKKVTLGQLKKVYRRGAGAFSSSHRPGMSRGGWAMARVNMFLKMKRGGKVKDSYRKADQDISKSSSDIEVEYSDEEMIEANLDLKAFDLVEEDEDALEDIFPEEVEAELTKEQKTLPPFLQKKILEKKGKPAKDKKDSKKDSKKESDKKEKESDAKKGLWENIRDKKRREGKNYRPAKPGDKDYPDPKAVKKAQSKKDETSKDFKPHDMYDPETGKAYKAKSYEEHMKYKKMGYTHEKPSESGYKSKKKKKY